MCRGDARHLGELLERYATLFYLFREELLEWDIVGGHII